MAVDIAIIECGMGGEYDATNIFTPILSIITSVSLEHTFYLGRSLSEIAYNKAGIIKFEVPCLIAELDESATFAVREYAKEMNAPLHIVDDYHFETVNGNIITFYYRPYSDLVIGRNNNTKKIVEMMRIYCK